MEERDKMKNNNLIKYLAIPLVALGIGGCKLSEYEKSNKCKDKNNLSMEVWENGMGKYFRIDEKDSIGEGTSYIVGLDNFSYSEDGILDGKIDELKLRGVLSGNSLEKLSLDSINKLFKEVKETGCNCDSIKRGKN
jgi:hypothetical protein